MRLFSNLRSTTQRTLSLLLAIVLFTTITPLCVVLDAQSAQAALAVTNDTALKLSRASGSQYAKTSAQVIPASGDFSVEAWVKPETGINNYAIFLSQGSSGQNFYMQIVNDQLVWNYGSANAWAGYMKPDHWTHVAFTHSTSSGVKIYLNGQLTYSWGGTLTGVGPGLDVGTYVRDEPGYGWKGAIDEVRVHSSARTATQVASDMHTYANTAEASLAAYYDFNDQTLTNKDTLSKLANSDLVPSSAIAWEKIANETSVGDQKYLSFSKSFITAEGGWSVPSGARNLDVIVVGGGGGGGATHGGGGGGGGLRNIDNLTVTTSTVTADRTLNVKVGVGGLGGRGSNGVNGENSSISGAGIAAVDALGGGGGGGGTNAGLTGGSGGGGGARWAVGGSGTLNQGNSGGKGYTHYYNNGTGDENWQGGGGGGAGEFGISAWAYSVGRGGAGKVVPWFTQSIQTLIRGGEYHGGGNYSTSGTSFTAGVYFAAGGSGGGGGFISYPSPGPGGGGRSNEGFATANTGGGGGGGTRGGSWGGNGGSGVVVLSYTTVPNVPTALRAVALDEGRVNLSWTAPAENDAILSDYTIEQSTDNSTWTTVVDGVSLATNYTVSGLSQKTKYYFRISAKNDASTSLATTSVFATTWVAVGSGQCIQYVSDETAVSSAALVGDSCVVTLKGNTDWSVPAGLTEFDSLLVGGGGGGGAQAGSGGGGGSVADQKVKLGASQISQLSVTVGTGGVGAKAEGTLAATAGGASTLTGSFGDNGFTITSPGGKAGTSSTSSSAGASATAAAVPTFTATGTVITEVSKSKVAGGLGGAGQAWTPFDSVTSVVGQAGTGGYSATSPFSGNFGGGGGGGPVSGYLDTTSTFVPAVSYAGNGINGGGLSAFAATDGTYTPATSGTALSGGGGGAGTYSGATTAEADGAAGGSGVLVIKYPLVTAPILLTSPDNLTQVSGSSASFSASFGSAASEIKWQKSITAGTTWVDIAGSTTTNAATATYTLTATTSMNGERYRAVATNINGAATASTPSNSAILTVTANTQTLPVGGVCDGSVTTNGLTTSAGHGKVFYIDTGQGQEIDAGYLAYTVKSATARSDLWVEISGFTGGIMSLADPSTKATPLGAVTANGTGTAFFLVKATGATTVAQSHIIRVYDQKPTIGSPLPLYECSFSFTRVDETIKAAANKVEGVTSTTVSSIGSTWTMTVKGDSGTIGSGNDIDGRMFWLIPAARSTWPVSGVRLEKTELKMYSDSARLTQLGTTHVNTLRINNANGLATLTRQYWTAIYTFRIIGPAASAAPIIPVAMISSGTQIKHTDVASVAGGTLNLASPPPPISLTVNKNVSSLADVRSDGTTRFDYEVVMQNTGTNDLVIDEVIDTPDAKAAYVAGTAKYSTITDPTAADFVSLRDPEKIGTTNSIAFTGPLTIPANSTRKIIYSMAIETCKVGQSFTLQNTATARSGSVTIGSGSATQSLVTVNGNCGSSQVYVFEQDVSLPPQVITGIASGVSTTGATISGSIDPNGVAGRALRFSYAQSAALVGSPLVPSVDLAVTTSGTESYGVNTALSGLQPNTTYYYQLEVEVDGVWQVGEILSFTTDAIVSTPIVETDPVTLVTATSALFNGLIDPNQVTNGAKVIFEYAASATCPPTGALSSTGNLQVENASLALEDAVFTGSTPTYVSLVQSGLSANTEYCVRIVGLYSTTSRVEGGWVSFKTSPTPEAPVKSPQTITWFTGTKVLPAGGTTTVQAFADSLLNVTYTSVDPRICTVDAHTGFVTAVTTSGNCSITATQEGNGSFYAAEPQTISFTISPPVITTTSLATGTYGTAYSQTIVATGGNGTYSHWTVETGETPPGLSLNSSTGQITGTPTLSGIYTIYVSVVSNGIVSEIQPLTITINKVPLTVATASLKLTYGDPVPAIKPVYTESEFLSPDTSAVISASYNVAPTCSTNYVQGTNAGVSTTFSQCSNGWATNYSFVYLIGSIEIAPLKVEIRALDAAKKNDVSGTDTTVSADPSFKYSISPSLPAGQKITDVLTAQPTFSRVGSGTSVGTYPTSGLAGKEVPGTYKITPAGTRKIAYTEPETVSGVTTNVEKYNYEVTFVQGNLAITEKIVPQLVIPNHNPIQFGTDLTGLLDAAGTHNGATVPGSYTYTYLNSEGVQVTLTESKLLPAGDYSVLVTFTPNDQTLYHWPITGVLNITVKPFALKVIALNSAKQNLVSSSSRIVSQDPKLSYVVGPALPTGQTLSDVFPNGVDVLRELAGVPSGTYPIANTTIEASEKTGIYDITAFGSRASNYSITYVPADFVITEKIVPEVGATDATIMERDTLGARLNATGTYQSNRVPGTFEYSYFDTNGLPQVVTSQSTLPKGVYTLMVKFTPTDASTYFGPVYGVMILTVNPYVAPKPKTPKNKPQPGSGNYKWTPLPGGTPVTPGGETEGPLPISREPYTSVLPTIPGLSALLDLINSSNPEAPNGKSPLAKNPLELANSGTNLNEIAKLIPTGTTVDFGQGVVTLSAKNINGFNNSSGKATRSLDELGSEKLGGFHPPGAGVRVEVIGARTGARFVMADVEVVDQAVTLSAIKTSITAQRSDFFEIQDVKTGVAPVTPKLWSAAERKAINQFFNAAGLEAPRSLADENLKTVMNWIEVQASASTYVPGSTVYLTLTSTPLIIGSAVVNKQGNVDIVGAMPVELLGAGEHRIRLIGSRLLDGIVVAGSGEVQVSAHTLDEINRFDPGTQATISIVGRNKSGGGHLALRIIPLDLTAPWWTIFLLFFTGLVLVALRRRGKLNSAERRFVAIIVITIMTLPAVILGWISTATDVVWVGLALSIALNVATWLTRPNVWASRRV